MLSDYTGPSAINRPGTIIDSKLITSCLSITAKNVSITNSLIRAKCGAGYVVSAYRSGATVALSDTEIDGLNDDGRETGVFGTFSCTRCKVHKVGEGFHLVDNDTVADSYVFDLFGGSSSHNNAIISNGGGNYVITHNNLQAIYSGNWGTSTTGISSAMSLFGDFGVVHDVLIQDNLIASGGGYCTYGGSVPSKAYPHADHIRYIDNQFSTIANAKCGEYGPVAYYDASEPGNSWSDNIWADGPNAGDTISP